VFRPRVGPFALVDLENGFATAPNDDIFALKGIASAGANVVVRPDQWVSNVFPLTGVEEIADFFRWFASSSLGHAGSGTELAR